LAVTVCLENSQTLLLVFNRSWSITQRPVKTLPGSERIPLTETVLNLLGYAQCSEMRSLVKNFPEPDKQLFPKAAPCRRKSRLALETQCLLPRLQ